MPKNKQQVLTYLWSGFILRKSGSMVSSGRFHVCSACSKSSEVSSRLLARSEATVFLLSLSPMEVEAFEDFFFSAGLFEVAAVNEVSAEAAMAAPAFSLFISKAACIAEKLWESKRLSKAAANCCWRICSAKKTPDRACARMIKRCSKRLRHYVYDL